MRCHVMYVWIGMNVGWKSENERASEQTEQQDRASTHSIENVR